MSNFISMDDYKDLDPEDRWEFDDWFQAEGLTDRMVTHIEFIDDRNALINGYKVDEDGNMYEDEDGEFAMYEEVPVTISSPPPDVF